jgi:signal transduction histidine kinase
VTEATSDLRRSNDDLVKSYQRMFALRESLARAEQTAAAGQTAATLAHQIGTPLNLISGYVQMMREDESCDARADDRLRSMEDQIRRVTGHIRATLDAVRRPTLPREPILPGPLLHRLVETARPRLAAAKIALDARIGERLPFVLGDAIRLELALLNIVNNALDALSNGGTLTIVGEARGHDLHVEIGDTGSGIAAELLPRIFDPWITTKPAHQGTGLGLSIARDVITGHGGRIDVASTPGVGTIFTIDLPGQAGSPAAREA